MKRAGLLLCMIGPSGGGKSTFAERLLDEEGAAVRLSISLTTRAARSGERDGCHYHFVSRPEFTSRVARGELFEWEEVHGNCYGTLRSTLEDAVRAGVDLILDVDIRGALNFKRAYPLHAVIVFLAPPAPAVLRERLRSRGGLSEEELGRRLATARAEYRTLLEVLSSPGTVDYFVVNNELEAAYCEVRAIVMAERARLSRLDPRAIGEICRID